MSPQKQKSQVNTDGNQSISYTKNDKISADEENIDPEISTVNFEFETSGAPDEYSTSGEELVNSNILDGFKTLKTSESRGRATKENNSDGSPKAPMIPSFITPKEMSIRVSLSSNLSTEATASGWLIHVLYFL